MKTIYVNEIKKKSWVKQLVCRHRNVKGIITTPMTRQWSGESIVHVCKDCGRVLHSEFAPY